VNCLAGAIFGVPAARATGDTATSVAHACGTHMALEVLHGFTAPDSPLEYVLSQSRSDSFMRV
jgi:hypothetical protein